MIVCAVGLRGIPNVAGGVETHCAQLYPRLAKLRPDDEFIILGRSAYVGSQPYEVEPGVRVHPLAAIRHGHFEAISNTLLGVLVARFQFSGRLVHIHAIGPGLLVPLARLLGLTVVFTHHGDDFARAKWNRLAKLTLRAGENLALRFAHQTIAVSPSLAERLKRDYPGKAAIVSYIPNGADHFKAVQSDLHHQLARFNLEEGRYIVSVGRLVPEKGFDDLVAAHRKLSNRCKLVIIGGSSNSDYDKVLLSQASSDVIFTGSLPLRDVAALVKGAALFVLASHHEGLPIVALEALAVGAPVLLSDIQPNVDIGLPGQHYFPTGNVDKLSAALDASLLNPPRAPLNSRFYWAEIAAAVSRVYDAARKRSGITARVGSV